MLSATHGYKYPRKDRVSVLPPLRDKSKAFSKDNKLKGSPTPSGLFVDLANQELGPPVDSIPKYSDQDFQQIL